MAMFKAFNLPWDPEAFTDGKFIGPDLKAYEVWIEEALQKGHFPEHHREQFLARGIQGYFKTLLNYRMQVANALSYPSTFLEASGWWAYALDQIVEFNRVIESNLSNIDETLTFLISPTNETFTVELLAAEYGYPDVDLREIDADWW